MVDPLDRAANLKAPFSPLLAQLDRPRRHDGLAQGGARRPATSSAPSRSAPGPFKFVERVQQDRIVLEQFAGLLEQGQRPLRQDRLPADRRLDGAAGQPASGQLDFIERVLATDLHGDRGRRRALKLATRHRARLPGHHASTSARASRARTRSARTRACARRSSWRSTARRYEVVFNGEVMPGNQWVEPGEPLLPAEVPGPEARRRQGQGSC